MTFRKLHIFTTLTGVALAASVSGCYSATTTPAISAGDVKRELAENTTPDWDPIASVNAPPPLEWKAGKQWTVTDNRLQLILSPMTPGMGLSELKGRTITLARIDSTPSIMGANKAELILSLTPDSLMRFRTKLSPDELLSRHSFTIPFTVDLDIVARADSILRGKQLYVMTSTWLDSLGRYMKARKFIPVEVTSVTAGTNDAPMRVNFRAADNPSLRGNLLVALSSDPNRMRAFNTMFAQNDPRLTHPDIFPETWELIMRSEVAQYMTRDECRLALGSPRSVDRREMFGLTRETWYYDNGVYLIFDDGILKQFST